MNNDRKQALRLLLKDRQADESYTDVATRLLAMRDQYNGERPEVGGHDWKPNGTTNEHTGFQPVKCSSCLIVSKLQRDVTHSVPRHEVLQVCIPAPENAQLARVIVELDGRRGYATMAMVPFWTPEWLDRYMLAMDAEVEWCAIFTEKLAFQNVVRLAIVDMLQGGR